MNRQTVSGIMVTLLLVGTLLLAFNIQPVRAIETIYIRPDGSIDPPTAPIHRDGDLYTFTGNIFDSIVIERDNIVVDGAGYTLQGTGAYASKGIDLSGRENVTVRNTQIQASWLGISLGWPSSNNSISGNNIANNNYGILLGYSCNYNSISGNNITANKYGGISLQSSNYNSIFGNNIANNAYGIYLYGLMSTYSKYNSIFGNNIANNGDGIRLTASTNIIHHNNFIDNSQQVEDPYTYSINVWDDGYPSGGNYWSDYEGRYPDAIELDGSGIWDTPYFIDGNNQDNFPLMEPWTPSPPIPTTIGELETKIEELGSEGEIDNQGIVASLIAKLNVAQKLIDDGKIDQAKNILNAFINEVQAQSEKHISPDAADILIESVEYILSHL